MILGRFCIDPFWDKSSFVASIEDAKPVLILNRFCNLLHPNQLCACSKTGFEPTLNQPFWINISTVSEVRCDCQGLGFVARIEAPILVFDTKQVLYWPVLGQTQFCSFDKRCKTCLDTKPVLYQGRFCSLTDDIIECMRQSYRKIPLIAITEHYWYWLQQKSR